MSNKTPLQELIEWINERPDNIPESRRDLRSKATELLEKEKNEMAKCFLAGMNRAIGDRPNQPNFEEYFNQTFIQ